MNYGGLQNLNELDVATPLNGDSQADLAAAIREIKTVLKAVLLVSHKPEGSFRTIEGNLISANSVGTATLVEGSVTTAKLADNSVTSTKLADNSVSLGKIADGAVTLNKLADASIHEGAFRPNSIPAIALKEKLTGAGIGFSALVDADRAITTDHIKDLAVTDAKIDKVSVTKLIGGAPLSIAMRVADAWAPVVLAGALSYNTATNQFEIVSPIKLAIIGDVRNRGSNGGAATAGAWLSRSIGEVSDNNGIINFSGNTFTLIAGKYQIVIRVPASNVGKHQARLKVNKGVAGTEIALWGTSASAVGVGSQTESTISGFFEVTSVDWVFSVEHYCLNTVGDTDLGIASSSDNAIVYANHKELFTNGYLVKL